MSRKIPADIINSVFPISGCYLYQNGTIEVIRVSRITQRIVNPYRDSPERKITRLSSRSMSRLLLLTNETQVEFKSLLTLTYSTDSVLTGRKTKGHLNHFLTMLRCDCPSVEYIWIMEFTKRGTPHYHIVLNFEPSDYDRNHIAVIWSQIVSRETFSLKNKMFKVHSHKRCWENFRIADGAMRYIAKYALKPYQKKIPDKLTDTGRFWGASRGVRKSIPAPLRISIDEDTLRDSINVDMSGWEVLPKYIFDRK